jgi:DNA modification methylase
MQIRNYKTIKCEDLRKYELNSRTHSEEQINQIVASIKEFGFTNPLLVDSDNMIIAGHGRLEAALKLGVDEVPCVILDGLTEAQKRAYIIADNKLALNAGWNVENLMHEFEFLKNEDFNLELTGFGLDEFVNMFPEDEPLALCDEDDCPDVPDEPTTKLGDVWLLGEHRLMCGDSTSIDAADKLMNGAKADMVFTDPPYGVSADGARGKTKKKKGIQDIINDDLRDDELMQFILSALSTIPLKENGSFYICYDQKTQHEFTGVIKSMGWRQRSTIIWNKNVFGLSGFKGYRPQFELIAFGHSGDDYTWFGNNAQPDVWDIPRPTERHGNHPTPKPIELVCRAISNSSEKGQSVLDLFGGSGSTLIACEKLKRKCYIMELDPKYCDVIIKRYEQYSGKKAKLESDNEPSA